MKRPRLRKTEKLQRADVPIWLKQLVGGESFSEFSEKLALPQLLYIADGKALGHEGCDVFVTPIMPPHWMLRLLKHKEELKRLHARRKRAKNRPK